MNGKNLFELGCVLVLFFIGYTVNVSKATNNDKVVTIERVDSVVPAINIDNDTYSETIGRKKSGKYSISNNGLNHIKQYEKFSNTPYKDNYGYSIGYGHLIKKNEKLTYVSKKHAEKLFKEDIQWVNDAVNRIYKDVRFEPTQGMIDATASIIYNCGEEGMKQSEFYKRLLNCRVKNGKANINDLNFTAAAIKVCRIPSVKTGCKEGVENRRYSEQLLFLN